MDDLRLPKITLRALQKEPPLLLTRHRLDALIRQVEAIPETGDFQADVALGMVRDRLLQMWAEEVRRGEAIEDHQIWLGKSSQ
jgi:hypothetical protein